MYPHWVLRSVMQIVSRKLCTCICQVYQYDPSIILMFEVYRRKIYILYQIASLPSCLSEVTTLVKMKPVLLLSIILGSKFVRSAINANGTQAIIVSEGDPSPIADIDTYYPDQHDCPLPCTDYANIHSWITYFSLERLRRCSQPMYVQTRTMTL
jgi:hypothetical protein